MFEYSPDIEQIDILDPYNMLPIERVVTLHNLMKGDK